MPEAKHMSLEEWDRRIAPYLAMIEHKATSIQKEADFITEWVHLLPAAPDFESRAYDTLKRSLGAVILAGENLSQSIKQFQEKDKVK